MQSLIVLRPNLLGDKYEYRYVWKAKDPKILIGHFVICLPFYQKNNKKIPNEMVEFHPKNNIYIT